MSQLRAVAGSWLAAERRAVVVEVVEARGSVPRETGTRMLVGARDLAGTVGGGHLELKAIAHARELLREASAFAPHAGHAAAFAPHDAHAAAFAPHDEPAAFAPHSEHAAAFAPHNEHAAAFAPHHQHYPLGPALGQCCGGAVTLAYSLLDAAALARWPVEPPRFHLQLYGAGHVGRAIVRALAPFNVVVDWIDERDEEFPVHFYEHGELWPDHIRKVCVDSVEAEVDTAPAGAYYLVLTHQHDLDLRISEAILRRGDFGFFGLIGSKTKRNRFIHRFEAHGIASAAIERMTCPIGIAGIDGKEPEVIAAAVVAQLLLVAGRDSRPQTAARAAELQRG